jgi:DNA polymerase-3 subunit gamma/tau
MSYQVIARKYRPQRFRDVVGQEHVTQTLSRAIEQKRIAHAYLFCGPRGTGKTTIARIFAKCLNCTDGPKVDFSDDDPRCQEIAEGRALDVFEIDGASNNGVEQVRELRETCKYAPASSRFKIYIIDEVHMLSTAAFNALLKTLEEPPEHVKFLFATTDPEKVLPTILSRCQRFDLRQIPAALIAQHLLQIAKLEGVNIEDAAVHAIARGAEGAMRDAESALDQLISFCGDKLEETDVLSMFGLTAQTQIHALARTILSGELENALRQLNELANHGKDLVRLLSDLLNHFRNLLIYLVTKGDRSMLQISEAEAIALADQSRLIAIPGVTRILEVLTETEIRLREAASKKTVIEVALLNAMEARNAVSIDTVLKQLQELRDSRGESPARSREADIQPAPTSAFRVPEANLSGSKMHETIVSPVLSEPAASPQESAPIPPAPKAALDLPELWAALLEAVGRASPFTRTYLLEAHAVSLNKNLLTIGFDPEFEDHLSLVDNARNHALLQTKLSELGYPDTQIKFIKAEAPAGKASNVQLPTVAAKAPTPPPRAKPPTMPSAPAPQAVIKDKPETVSFRKEDFKNDALIQKALEIFKGQIVEVRV